MKRFLSMMMILAMVAALSLSFALAEESTVVYQTVGDFGELKDFGMNFDFLGNFLNDGTGIMYILTTSSYSDGVPEEVAFTWTAEEDRDGVVTLTLSDGVNPSGDYSVYEEDDGTFPIDYYFTFAGGAYNRIAPLVISKEITIDSADEWLASLEGKYADESTDASKKASVAVYRFGTDVISINDSDDVLDDCIAVVQLFADGTAKAEDGYGIPGEISYALVTEEGTWTMNEDSSLTIVLNEKEYTAVEDAEVGYTFTWSTTHDEGETSAVMVLLTEDAE